MEKTLLGLSELHDRFCANARYFYVKQGSKAGYLSPRLYLVDNINGRFTLTRPSTDLSLNTHILLCSAKFLFFCWGPANLTPICIGHEEQMVLYLPMNFYLGQRIRTGEEKGGRDADVYYLGQTERQKWISIPHRSSIISMLSNRQVVQNLARHLKQGDVGPLGVEA